MSEIAAQLDSLGVKGFTRSPIEAEDRIAPHVGAWLRPVCRGSQDHIGVVHLSKRVNLARIPGLTVGCCRSPTDRSLMITRSDYARTLPAPALG